MLSLFQRWINEVASTKYFWRVNWTMIALPRKDILTIFFFLCLFPRICYLNLSFKRKHLYIGIFLKKQLYLGSEIMLANKELIYLYFIFQESLKSVSSKKTPPTPTAAVERPQLLPLSPKLNTSRHRRTFSSHSDVETLTVTPV